MGRIFSRFAYDALGFSFGRDCFYCMYLKAYVSSSIVISD